MNWRELPEWSPDELDEFERSYRAKEISFDEAFIKLFGLASKSPRLSARAKHESKLAKALRSWVARA